jgi:hypothetical protein
MQCEPIHIVLDNLPATTHWLVEWSPILIAGFALVVSILSSYYTRRQFVRTTRPYVSAGDFAHINANNEAVHNPTMFMFLISQAPAKFIKAEYLFEKVKEHERQIIFQHKDANLVRYPDPRRQYDFTFAELPDELKKLDEQSGIERNVLIIYSGLSGGKKYKYEWRSLYNQSTGRWDTVYENGT